MVIREGLYPSTFASANPDAELGRLRWHCRRSCLEIDLLLNTFLDRGDGYAALDAAEKDRFARLLEQADDDLLPWLLGRSPCPNPAWRALLDKIVAAQRGA